jgi:NADH:ubiquinone oxidoreductase subunit K
VKKNIIAVAVIYLTLQVVCGAVTAVWLHASVQQTFGTDFAGWSMPALYAYASQFILSVALIRSGRGSLISNVAKSLLALLMSVGIMVLSSYLFFRDIRRVEFQGVDYVGAFAIYALTIPAQLIVVIAGPLLLAHRNARTRSATLVGK